MLIGYSDKKIENLCENPAIAQKKLGKKVMLSLMERLQWLDAADNLSIFNTTNRTLRLHKLKGKHAGSYAIDLTERYRLIFYPCDEEGVLLENENFEFVTIITVEEVSNHYGD